MKRGREKVGKTKIGKEMEEKNRKVRKEGQKIHWRKEMAPNCTQKK